MMYYFTSHNQMPSLSKTLPYEFLHASVLYRELDGKYNTTQCHIACLLFADDWFELLITIWDLEMKSGALWVLKFPPIANTQWKAV
jgi:hypothetical protein